MPRRIARLPDAAPIACWRQARRGWLDAAGPVANGGLGERAILGHHRAMSGIAILKLQRAGFTEQQVEALAEYFDSRTATKVIVIGPSGELSVRRPIKQSSGFREI
ncbi:MAG: hypothetical protein WB678_08235 [Stellaceae bacterium]